MDWQREAGSWPHAERSRFVDADGLRWHVQQWPAPRPGAPTLLLLHGTGASTHTWRDIAPALAADAGVIAIDLPGHGFTAPARGGRATLPAIARGVRLLMAALGESPSLRVGHSAGAAIAVRGAIDEPCAAIVGLNAALLPLPGLAGRVFSPLARLLAATPLVPRLFASRAGDPAALRRLIAGTGSTLDAAGTDLYRRLVGDHRHVAGALAMMAHWDLDALFAALPRLTTPLHLVVGDADATVPPASAARVLRRLPPATARSLTTLRGLGHLAHEERPAEIVAIVRRLLG